MFTLFTEEITGDYYEEKTDWTYVVIVIISVIITMLIIADAVFGAENVTEFIAGLIS